MRHAYRMPIGKPERQEPRGRHPYMGECCWMFSVIGREGVVQDRGQRQAPMNFRVPKKGRELNNRATINFSRTNLHFIVSSMQFTANIQ
jgi:hypothetical protein